MNDLTRAQYSGQHGFLKIEARDDPARYDQEFFLALHDWGGHLLANQDGAMNPDLNVSPLWEINIGIGATGSTDHLIVKAILGRRFDWGRHSPVD